MMDSVTIENFRCFRQRQTGRLAPLTLLVGENSTGKTSFMAMIRALAVLAYDRQIPDFKESPYDLGSFDEIAHFRGGSAGRAESFTAEFRAQLERGDLESKSVEPYVLKVVFTKRGSAPVPTWQRAAWGGSWVEETIVDGERYTVRIGNSTGEWRLEVPHELDAYPSMGDYTLYLHETQWRAHLRQEYKHEPQFEPIDESSTLTLGDVEAFDEIKSVGFSPRRSRPLANAPVRSRPRRTYDPAQVAYDPDGASMPMYLAERASQSKSDWALIKTPIETFGQASGLFDELSIQRLGSGVGAPFQVQMRKGGKGRKGPMRNLIDMGYGVSQVLPVVTELFQLGAPKQHLIQQPEVHLHPQAQAELGTLFCAIAKAGSQLVVETHSDYLIDRVRMDVRDGTADLKPEDVSVLYFERNGLDVTIHSLQFDDDGNPHVAPDANGDIPEMPESYRRFFMEETRRTLGL